MKPKILYGLKKIKYVKVVDEQGITFEKKKSLGRYKENGEDKFFTYDELENFMGKEKVEKVFNWDDKEYEPVFISDDMEDIFKSIDRISIKQIRDNVSSVEVRFLGNVKVGIEYAFSPITGKRYDAPHFFIDWNGIKASCGGGNLSGVKKEFKDKIRRYYNFNDPYKIKVSEEFYID